MAHKVATVFNNEIDLADRFTSCKSSLRRKKTQRIIQIATQAHNELYDITRQVKLIVSESGIETGMVNVYAQGATAAIMIQFYMIDPLFTNLKV